MATQLLLQLQHLQPMVARVVQQTQLQVQVVEQVAQEDLVLPL
jgi:hypothetical protein